MEKTTEQLKQDIRKHFGNDIDVHIASIDDIWGYIDQLETILVETRQDRTDLMDKISKYDVLIEKLVKVAQGRE